MEPNLPISAFAIGKLSFALLCALNGSVLPTLTYLTKEFVIWIGILFDT